jgi:hypothetical protein
VACGLRKTTSVDPRVVTFLAARAAFWASRNMF